VDRGGLVRAWGWGHNSIVTITYPNGTVVKAIVLTHEEHEIRAVATSCDDVLAFTRIHGTWISEKIEPVAIEFGWEGKHEAPAPCEDDYICPKELAARLIQKLFAGTDGEDAGLDGTCGYGPEESRVASDRTELPM
jgi:hypothetical protein